VRSLTAIICLTAFLALQYGKLVSYWHCKLASIYTSTSCDCVKQLLDLHKDGTQHPTSTIKEKTEEIVLFHEWAQSWQLPGILPITYEIAYLQVVPETSITVIFQPPRIIQFA